MSAGSRVLSLGKGSFVVTPTDSFGYGYQNGKRIFRMQTKTRFATVQDFTNCLQVLLADICQPRLQPDKPQLYDVGKLAGWLIAAIRETSLPSSLLDQNEEIQEQASLED
jgi:hypothetical protein